MAEPTVRSKTPAPLKVDIETDRLITQGAHFLNVTKKDLVADAVKIYMELKREEIRRGVIDAMKVLDGSLKADVMALTGLTAEEIDAVGGIED
ncbi:hypothetical protein ACTWPT_07010 [Nonomuraea sp. 3N208]|uniref:hypothetical protein n=1 Tax=Nonomuraea sp. 3N208 TaxID=3457421 RepID=UPI003FCCFC60